VVISDTENHRIQIFGSEGTYKHKFGMRGTEPGNLCYPISVAMTTDDCIAVTDSVNACVKVFSQNGDFQNKYGSDSFLEFPYGLAISHDNFMIISDICKHCIYVLYPSGGICSEFGSYGSEPKEFDHPYFVTVNREKQIIVSDSGNCSIKIFLFEGKLLRVFSNKDYRIGDNFCALQGLCTDSQDNTIVICNNAVYIVTKNGRLWEVLTSKDGLNYPKCIAFSQSGRLVVTQSVANDRNEAVIMEYNAEDFKSLNSLLLYAISV
jgi:tripartite motif-containing protein 2/3